MDTQGLLASVSPPLDRRLTEALFEEFIALERRYVLGDWEPATLDGGQLAEIAARVMYHTDSGNLAQRKSVAACLRYVENEDASIVHRFPHRRSALHLSRTIRLLYKFRSQRGAVHIDPDYNANELDSTLVISVSRWLVSEILRLFWNGDTTEVAKAIREIVRYEVPAVLVIDDRQIVLRTDCTAEEEILLLLHNAGEDGLSRSELGKAAMKSRASVSNALTKLASSQLRQIAKRRDATYVLTPVGSRRIHEELSEKLTL